MSRVSKIKVRIFIKENGNAESYFKEYFTLTDISMQEALSNGWACLRGCVCNGKFDSDSNFAEFIFLMRSRVALLAKVVLYKNDKDIIFQEGYINDKINVNFKERSVKLTVSDKLEFLINGSMVINRSSATIRNFTQLMQDILNEVNCDYKIISYNNALKVSEGMGLKNTNFNGIEIYSILPHLCNLHRIYISSNGRDELYIRQRTSVGSPVASFYQKFEDNVSVSNFTSIVDSSSNRNIPSRITYVNIIKTKGEKGNKKKIAFEQEIDGGIPHLYKIIDTGSSMNLVSAKAHAENYIAGLYAAENQFTIRSKNIFNDYGGLFNHGDHISLVYADALIDSDEMVVLSSTVAISATDTELEIQVTPAVNVDKTGNITKKVPRKRGYIRVL